MDYSQQATDYQQPGGDNITDLMIPPHSIPAEQAVLGGLMLDNQAWDSIANKLAPNDFYRENHRTIFDSISKLVDYDKPVDVITLSEHLDSIGKLEAVGGLAYLGTLAKDTPSAANIEAYADSVRERSVLRKLRAVSVSIGELAFKPEGRTASDLIEEAEQKVFEIADQSARNQTGFVSAKDLAKLALDRIDELFSSDSHITGIATGLDDFDSMTAGMQRGDLIIVAGRPSMGKTTFAMNIAEHVAIQENKPVAVFSMEMPGDSLVLRMLASLGRIDSTRVRTGKLNDEDWPRITSAINLISNSPMFIDDTGSLSPADMRARARRLTREHGELGMIVIDYMQLMQVPGSSENRATEMSAISRSLKAMAKELNVPVVALSQLNRNLEQRPNKRPMPSDLRESGSIEQDADVIVFIYRDEVYNPESPDKGTAEIIIGKQRNGPIGTVRTTFLGKYTRFENFTPDQFYDDYE